MKKVIFFIALAITANIVQAAFVAESTAKKVAENWFANRSPKEANGRKIVKYFTTKNQDLPVFYTYAFENGGFVIVSADDSAEPIIGYSYTSPVTEKIDHPAVKSWLDNYSSEVAEISRSKADNSETLPKWKKILDKDFSAYKNGKAVQPLVKTKWDQGAPYDMYVPNLPSGAKCAVGCVATAMAQIMNYYQWPLVGQGSNSYTPSITGQTISANFGTTTYEWSKTLDDKTSNGSPKGAKHTVALLSSHNGIAVNMMYGESSGAYSEDALWSLIHYFGYKSTATMKSRYSYSSTWDALLKAELDQNRPLYYAGSGSGGGHAFVCDGYQESDNKFHYNWGWSGSYDGYFVSNALNPQGVGTGGGTGGFNSSQKAFFNLWDYSTKPEKVSSVSLNDIGSGTQIQLKWHKNSASNIQKYKIYVGTESYMHSTTHLVTDTVFTVPNLSPGTLYYFGITALDAENDESKLTEVSYRPQVAPATPANLTAIPDLMSVKIVWNSNNELDLAGYNLYKSLNNVDFSKVNTTLITDTVFIVQNPAHDSYSYFKISAVDNDNNESILANSIPARPVTLDQGVLVIDESSNGTGILSSPDDAMQDAFYQAIMANVQHKQSFDAISAGKVTLSDLGAYSSILWHNQSVELGTIFNKNQAEIKKYLDFGGNILITADKPCKLVENITSYPIGFADTTLVKKYFGIDTVEYKTAARFCGATPAVAPYSYLAVDSTKALESNGFHIKKVEALHAKLADEIIYKYDSKSEAGTTYGISKGKTVGIYNAGSNYKTATLAIPLYFIKQDQAKQVVEYILKEKFGETVGIEENAAGQINGLTLFQNYPNPFNPTTTISFNNPLATSVKLAIYNVKGEIVKELVNGFTPAGIQKVSFDATGLNSGVYFYKVSTPEKNLVGKMMLLK